MDAASCPVLYTLRFGCGGSSKTKLNYSLYGNKFCTSFLRFSPRNCYTYGFDRKFKKLNFDRLVTNATSKNITEYDPSQKFAVLLEVEGVLIDVNRSGNRQAFNVAFRKLGLDCANWTEPVYSDLARKSAGDEERMLVLYFNQIGWPTSVATSEKQTFTKNILQAKKNALDDLVMSKDFSFRPGAEEFIDETFKEGVPVVILTACGLRGEKITRSIVEKLGADRISKIQIIGDEEVKQSLYGQLVFGKGVSSSLDEQLAKEVSKAASAQRQRIAEEVASMLKLKVELNNSSSESMQNIIAALRAGAEYAEVPIHNCFLVAGNQSGVAAAERIGMPCVAMRSSTTLRSEFPSATAVMDGFGGADLTISRLRKKLFS